MKRSLVFVSALMAALAMPLAAEARPSIGNLDLGAQAAAEHNNIQQVRRGGGGHFRGGRHFGGRHFGGHRGFRGGHFRSGRHWRGGRHFRGGRNWGHRGHWRGHRRYWRGRWWAYGVGSCWRWSPYYDRFVWVCY